MRAIVRVVLSSLLFILPVESRANHRTCAAPQGLEGFSLKLLVNGRDGRVVLGTAWLPDTAALGRPDLVRKVLVTSAHLFWMFRYRDPQSKRNMLDVFQNMRVGVTEAGAYTETVVRAERVPFLGLENQYDVAIIFLAKPLALGRTLRVAARDIRPRGGRYPTLFAVGYPQEALQTRYLHITSLTDAFNHLIYLSHDWSGRESVLWCGSSGSPVVDCAGSVVAMNATVRLPGEGKMCAGEATTFHRGENLDAPNSAVRLREIHYSLCEAGVMKNLRGRPCPLPP